MTDGLVAALARAQAKFPGVPKSRTAKVQMKAGGTYSYTYADLADVLAAVRPVLAAEGIALVQSTDVTDTGVVLVTRLLHGDETIEGRYPLHIAGSSPQEVGSLLTYFRRYTITALLGISAQDDDDGQQAQQSHRAPEPARPTTNLAGSKVVAALDPYVAAAGYPPEKPIAAMTMAELIAYGRQIGVVVSGSKADFVRTLEPYVLAATGEEPWPVDPLRDHLDQAAKGRDIDEARPLAAGADEIAFEPVVAKPTAERLLPPDARKSVRSQ